jgi:hypothetical protein
VGSALLLYGLGVLTGAVLCGWSPQFLERWLARRRAREEEFKARQFKRVIQKEFEKAAANEWNKGNRLRSAMLSGRTT